MNGILRYNHNNPVESLVLNPSFSNPPKMEVELTWLTSLVLCSPHHCGRGY